MQKNEGKQQKTQKHTKCKAANHFFNLFGLQLCILIFLRFFVFPHVFAFFVFFMYFLHVFLQRLHFCCIFWCHFLHLFYIFVFFFQISFPCVLWASLLGRTSMFFAVFVQLLRFAGPHCDQKVALFGGVSGVPVGPYPDVLYTFHICSQKTFFFSIWFFVRSKQNFPKDNCDLFCISCDPEMPQLVAV